LTAWWARARRVTQRGSLGRQVVVGAGLVGLLGAAGTATVIMTALQLRSAQRAANVDAVSQRDTETLLSGFVDQETGLRGYLLTGQRGFLQPYVDASATIPRTFDRLQAASGSVASLAAPLAAVRAAHQHWLGYATSQLALVAAGRRDRAVAIVATGTGKARFDSLRAEAGSLQRAARAAVEDTRARTSQLQRRLLGLLVGTLVLLGLVITVSVRVLLALVITPVQALAREARVVADGDLSAPIRARGAPEVAALARDVTAMRDRLLADARATEQALAALEQHGPAAASLREALLPRREGIAGLRVAGRMDPADGVLAGDWYDLIVLSDQRLGLVLGDVSGHGPRSAVLALRLKHTITAALRTGASPGEALTMVSRSLLDIPPDMFATVLVISVDVAADELTYANAGHPAALLLARATPTAPAPAPGGRATRVTTADGRELAWTGLPSTGPLLSPVVASRSWGDATHAFTPGATLIGFTDGLLEARDATGEQFGLDRLLEVVAAHDLRNGPRLLDALAAAVVRHTPTRRDDQTLVYARREGYAPAYGSENRSA
jgi:CHASE3 domain sensor protein